MDEYSKFSTALKKTTELERGESQHVVTGHAWQRINKNQIGQSKGSPIVGNTS